MQIYGDSDESEEDTNTISFKMGNEQSTLNVSHDDQQAPYYESELDSIIKNEFQNPAYQDNIIDGDTVNYSANEFKYEFPLQMGKLFYQPKLTDLFDIERPDKTSQILRLEERQKYRRGEQVCVASNSKKIAIGFKNPHSILVINSINYSSFPVTLTDEVVCIDFVGETEQILCGMNTGCLILIDCLKYTIVQRFQGQGSRLLNLKIVGRFDHNITAITTDIVGNAWLLRLKKGFFTYELETITLKPMKYPAATIRVLQHSDEVKYFVLMNIERLFLIRLILSTHEWEIIFEQENGMKIPKSSILSTSCSIGRGLIKKHKKLVERKWVILCSWDTVFFSIIVDDIESKRFILTGLLLIEDTILNTQFVKDSLFVLFTQTKGILLMNTINIALNSQNKKLCDQRYISFPESEKYQYISQEIKIPGYHMTELQQIFRRAVQTLLKKTVLVTTEKLPTNYNQSFNDRLFMNQHIVIATPAKWNKIVHSFYQQGEWLNGMHYLLSIYLGSNRYILDFLELSKSDRAALVNTQIHEIAIKYHQMIMHVIKYNQPNEFMTTEIAQEIDHSNKTLFAILIEFLLLSHNYDILFEQIMPQTTKHFDDGHKFLLDTLEPFYEKCLVKFIPKQVLLQIIEIYVSQKRFDLLQKMIWSLDHRLIETGPLITLCLKHRLLKSLAIICAKDDAEQFVTPLIKIWAVILQMVQKEEFYQAQHYTLRALSFIKSALLGKDVLGTDLQNAKAVVIRISTWLLNEDNLEKLLSFTPAPAFEVLLILLTGYNAVILNSLPLKDIKQRENLLTNNESNVAQAIITIEIVVMEKILVNKNDFQLKLRRQSMTEDKESDIQMHFNLFQIRINKEVPLRNRRIIKCIAAILKNLRSLSFIYLEELVNEMNALKLDELKKWPNQKEVIDYLKSEAILGQLLKVEKVATKSEQKEILELSHLADLTSLSSVCIHLAMKKMEYKRALDFYLYSKNSLIRTKVFPWLDSLMQQLKDTNAEAFEEMKQYLVLKITDLIKINSELTRDIFSRYNSESESTVIQKLEAYPELQLEYVENVIRKERDLGHKIDNQLLILNIVLLCKHNPDKIVDELKHHEYPLDNILQPCRQYNIRKATVYVLERLGNIQEAIALYCDILKDLFKQTMKDVTREYELATKLTQSEKSMTLNSLFKAGMQNMMNAYEELRDKSEKLIGDEIEIIIQVCITNNKFDQKDEIWYILLDAILDIRDNMLGNKEFELPFKKLCTFQVCHIIATIAEHSKLEILLVQLQQRYSNLDMAQLKLTFQEIIANYVYVESVLNNSKGLIKADIIIRIDRLLTKYAKGLVGKYVCGECSVELSTEGNYASEENDNVVFTCGHAYHRGCVVEQQGLVLCQICCKKDSQYAYRLLFLNNKIKLDKLTENLKLKRQSEQVDDADQQQEVKEVTLDIEIKPVVSKDTIQKRKRRTNKLVFWDKKRLENLSMLEKTNEAIDEFTQRQEKEALRLEMLAKLKKKKY